MGDLLTADKNPFPYVLKLITAGSFSMSLSNLFAKKIIAFITCAISAAFALFLLRYA
ncbi:hypothetical protein BFV94_4919 [Alteromonas macleodii]|uniref:Uncharacterized protein n=1 Tax=Alteromonas macleodii TaxID=28108 RepID=A0AB36FLA5_ALTMA|nr:hypothetical protein BFV93_4947 [Alteromonas macleodii]OES23969.1 hypothetical protein BFV94_4919 [Alteromonas macleodii]OES25669.1 hypothetical protein BFV95_4351 [Alteromonas macleodii]OES38919.1 hypothetical protein BFV96_4517 [Alteromonas macleodii]